VIPRQTSDLPTRARRCSDAALAQYARSRDDSGIRRARGRSSGTALLDELVQIRLTDTPARAAEIDAMQRARA